MAQQKNQPAKPEVAAFQAEEDRELAAADAEYRASLDVNPEALASASPTDSATTAILGQMTKVLTSLVGKSEAGPTPQIPFAQAKFKTPWNPTGKKYRVGLTRETYMNGHQLREGRLSEEEITLLNQLKAGKYYNKQWTVIETDEGDGKHTVEIIIPNRTQEQRMALTIAHGGRGLVGICEKILAEQNAIQPAG